MNREADAMRSMLDALTNTPFKSTKIALAQVKAVRDALALLKFRGAAQAQLDETRYQMHEAVKLDILESMSSEKADRETKMERVKDRWQSDRKTTRMERAERLQTMRSRYQAMDTKELSEVVDGFMTDDQYERDPEVLDALSGELRQRKPEAWEMVRAKMKERKSYEPWRQEGFGKEISDDLAQLDNCIKQPGTVPLIYDGKRSQESIGMIDEFMSIAEASE